jgi:hypothetical protein
LSAYLADVVAEAGFMLVRDQSVDVAIQQRHGFSRESTEKTEDQELASVQPSGDRDFVANQLLARKVQLPAGWCTLLRPFAPLLRRDLELLHYSLREDRLAGVDLQTILPAKLG